MFILDDTLHGVRVAKLAVDFAACLNSKKSDASILYNSCLFHDLGKLCLNQNLINKPGVFTAQERDYVKYHSLYGYWLATQMGFKESVQFNILLHHENFDGSGYPFGFKGESIPAISRIIRIIDCFDALTTERSYHKKYSVSESLYIMKNERRYYDPHFFNKFLDFISLPSINVSNF